MLSALLATTGNGLWWQLVNTGKYSRSTSCRSQFFSQRIVNVWIGIVFPIIQLISPH